MTDIERAYLSVAKFALEKARHSHVMLAPPLDSVPHGSREEKWRHIGMKMLNAEEIIEALLRD